MNRAKMLGASVEAALVCAATVAISAQASPSDLLKYMTPTAQKDNYLNQCQDKVIKKKNFKAAEIQGAQAISNKEIGLFAIIDAATMSDEQLKSLIQDPHVNGLSLLLTWQQLQPAEGEFNWQPIEKVIDLCRNSNRSLILRVSTCGAALGDLSDTPKWVYDAGAKSISYTSSDGKQHAMPIFWDPIYLAKWSNFVGALGKRYDNNPSIHSVGITGGGMLGGAAIIADGAADKQQRQMLRDKLTADFGMNEQKIVENWKYVADLFPHAFTKTRLNFDADPPLDSRIGQNDLDELSDYLIYRYGERVYLTGQDVENSKHGFDQVRVLLKFRGDTLTGYQLSPSFGAADLGKFTKHCLDDGISFVEMPAALLTSKDSTVLSLLDQLRAHLGYQLVSQKVSLPADIKSGSPLHASFTFVNLGAAAPMRPSRQFDKDVASSYKVELELRDAAGKPVVQSLHTPDVPTNQWLAGRSITWQQELKMPKLKPGEYSVWMSLIDVDTKRKLQILNAADAAKEKPMGTALAVGKIQVSPAGQ